VLEPESIDLSASARLEFITQSNQTTTFKSLIYNTLVQVYNSDVQH